MAVDILTHTVVASAKPGPKDYSLGDGAGLFLRVRASGHKGWILVYSLHGTRGKYTIGEFPTLSLSDARSKAKVARALVSDGIHPIDDDKRKAAEEKAQAALLKAGTIPQTVGELFQKWDENFLTGRHSEDGKYVRDLYTRHIGPSLNDLPLADLRTRHIAAVLDKAHATGLTRTCGVILSNLRQMFGYAVPRDWFVGDPTVGLKSEDWDGDSKECDRHLPEEELRELAGVLKKSKLPKRWKFAIKLILSVGTRAGETLNAPMANISLEKAEWYIPPELQKKTNRKTPPQPHLINLSPFAIAQIEAIIQLGKDYAKDKNIEYVPPLYLFPTSNGKSHVELKTLTKAVRARQLDEQVKGKTPHYEDLKLSGGEWSPQDLRRTMATLMGESGIPPDVIDKCLNHSEPNKIKRTYQRQQMRPAMKHAWLKVGQQLQTIFKDDGLPDSAAADEEEEDI